MTNLISLTLCLTAVASASTTCQHVECVKEVHGDHFKVRVYHTSNAADGADVHGPKAENVDPLCADSPNSMGCQASTNVFHRCTYDSAADDCNCLCDQVVATVPPKRYTFQAQM